LTGVHLPPPTIAAYAIPQCFDRRESIAANLRVTRHRPTKSSRRLARLASFCQRGDLGKIRCCGFTAAHHTKNQGSIGINTTLPAYEQSGFKNTLASITEG
jgi:hypothetical protein